MVSRDASKEVIESNLSSPAASRNKVVNIIYRVHYQVVGIGFGRNCFNSRLKDCRKKMLEPVNPSLF